MNYIELMRPIMAQAAQIALQHFRKPMDISFKFGTAGVQTNVDLLIEDFLKEALCNALPGSGFIAEESKAQNPQIYTWVIDPIDGTGNFVRGLSYFCINVALMHEQEIIAAMTVQPYGNEWFYAQKGHGFWCNDVRIDLSQPKVFDHRAIIVVSDFLLRQGNILEQVKAQVKNSYKEVKFRVHGAVALDLALTSAGVFDACIFQNLALWDMAPSILFFKEASGLIIDQNSQPVTTSSRQLIAGNMSIVPAIVDGLKSDSLKSLKKS